MVLGIYGSKPTEPARGQGGLRYHKSLVTIVWVLDISYVIGYAIC